MKIRWLSCVFVTLEKLNCEFYKIKKNKKPWFLFQKVSLDYSYQKVF